MSKQTPRRGDADAGPLGKGADEKRLAPVRVWAVVDRAWADLLDAACEEARLNRSEWIRGCLVNVLQRRPTFPRAETEALVHVRQELRRIGVTLRQAAGDLELAGYQETADEMRDLYRDARKQLEAVRAAVEGNLAYWGDRHA